MVIRVLSQPNHPARLAAIFAASVAALGIIAAAAYAGAWIWRDLTSGASSGAVATPSIETGGGLLVLTPVEDAAAFEELTGFAPFVPRRVPEGTNPAPSFAVAPPSDDGSRLGRVSFGAVPGHESEGISGPVVVIEQGAGTPGAGVDGALRQVGDGRALGAAFACGDLVLDVQLYFSPDDATGPEAITPHMQDVAVGFMRDILRQCESR